MCPVDDLYARFAIPKDTQVPTRGRASADWIGAYPEYVTDTSLCQTHGAYLIEGLGDRVVLVDAGFGPNLFPPYQNWPNNVGRLAQSLRTLGYELADVTDVVCTHLHIDHVGWLAHDGQVLMPNATVRCDPRDLVHFAGLTDRRVQQVLDTVQLQVDPWDQPGVLFRGLAVEAAYGHTPGSCVVRVSSDGEACAFVGDAVHTPIELIDDDWASLGDVDLLAAADVRTGLIDDFLASGSLIAGSHFPELAIGRLAVGPDGRRVWVPAG
jgi:glyoxylase-like metal-dependent hydrolase (beta-lactamase superfamily II)